LKISETTRDTAIVTIER